MPPSWPLFHEKLIAKIVFVGQTLGMLAAVNVGFVRLQRTFPLKLWSKRGLAIFAWPECLCVGDVWCR